MLEYCISKCITFIILQECPLWNDWSQWDDCSVTCGGGLITRRRDCANGEIGEEGCVGVSTESQVCANEVC